MIGRALSIVAGVFLAAVAIGGTSNTATVVLTDPARTKYAEALAPIKSFKLTDQDGHPFGPEHLKGRAALVFFGFTNCPNVCPPTMQKLRAVQRALQVDEDRFVVAMISVDGDRDTPDVMKAYLVPFEPGFIGLTGDPKLVRDVAADFSAVFFKGLPTDATGSYNVEHTSQTYLVDQAGQVRATFYNAPADDMIAVTRAML